MDTDKRLRKNDRKRWIDLKIKTKIVMIVLLVMTISVASISIFTYLSTIQNTRNISGDALVILGDVVVDKTAMIIQQSAMNLEVLALSPDIIELVEAANLKEQVLTDEDIKNLDEAWKENDVNINELASGIQNNALSDRLRYYLKSFPENIEVFITSKKGLNVAMTNRTSDYLQSDESWWKYCYNNGDSTTYIADVEYDASTEAYAINIAVPIFDIDNKETIGILRSTVNVSLLFDTISQIKIGKTGGVTLIDRNNTVLYSKNLEMLMQKAPEWMQDFTSGENRWSTQYSDLNGHDALLAYSQLKGDYSEKLRWKIFLDQDLTELEAPVRKVLINNIIIAAIVAIILAGFGFWMANSISQPIMGIAYAAKNLSIGDLNRNVDKKIKRSLENRRDEIGIAGQGLLGTEEYMIKMATIAQEISIGNLTQDIEPQSDTDELGFAFQRMVQDLRESISTVTVNADSVFDASENLALAADQASKATIQIAATIQDVARSTNQQATSISQTSASVDQMTQSIYNISKGAQEQASTMSLVSDITAQMSRSIQQVADNADSVSKNAALATQAAFAGSNTVEETIEGMQSIKRKVDVSAQKVQEMGQRSDQISVIVQTIDDIASQTNLLALNASIEAARAGEHGKGFTVVAEEVRKLAERSSEATKEIGELVKAIQKTITEAVLAMTEGATEVDLGVSRANAAGEALNEILDAAKTVNQQAEQAAMEVGQMTEASIKLVTATDSVSAIIEENSSITEEMAANSNVVVQAIENIASISEENNASIEEVSAATEEMNAQAEEVTAAAQNLARLAENLRQFVNKFTLS